MWIPGLVAACVVALSAPKHTFGIDTVRVAYLIPSNRSPQPDAVENIQSVILLLNSWFCEQMDRNGFGELSFRYETDVDGVTPYVHVVNVVESDAYLREDIWGRVNQAAGNAGVTTWTAGQVWILIPEIHQQLADSSITGSVALGLSSGGSGSDPGVAMINSVLLSLPMPDSLTDDREYKGLVIPGIGSLPLVESVSFPWFEGTTVSGISSSFVGAFMHETCHALGIGHDFRNDANFHGNLMYNGLRGIRGSLYPTHYPQDDTRLEYATAQTLSVSHYVTPCDVAAGLSLSFDQPEQRDSLAVTAIPLAPSWAEGILNLGPSLYCESLLPLPKLGVNLPEAKENAGVAGDGDLVRPELTVLTSGAVIPVDGHVEIQFLASDNVQLVSALLRFNGDTVGEMTLSGTSTSSTFRTAYYTPGAANSFSLSVYDTSGNRRDGGTIITPATGTNRAPQPFFKVLRSVVQLGSTTRLHATGSRDPDNAVSTLTVEWDTTGDGEFDTTPTTTQTLTTALLPAGTRLLRVRVTDSLGAQTVSTPIASRILSEGCFCFDLDGDGDADLADFARFQKGCTPAFEEP